MNRLAVRTATRVVLLLVAALGGLKTPAIASPIAPEALFLAPSIVPTADYTVGRTFSTDSDFLTLNIFPGSLSDLPAGSSLTGARILPLLNPNPGTFEGEYSDADLAAITEANYSSFFFRLPGTDATADYWADLDSSALAVHFNVTGQYFLAVDYTLGGSDSSTGFYHVEVNDFFGPINGPHKAGVARRITGPTTEFNVVSTTPPGDNKYADNAATEISNRLGAGRVTRAGTLQEACNKIKQASEAAGRKISVSLVGHGAPGLIKIGTELIGAGGTMTAKQFQACVDQYVNHIEFWSCDTAKGAAGSKFLKDFAKSIGSASGFKVKTTAATTYWDLTAGGVKGSSLPEPSLFLLATLATVAWHRRRWHSRN